MPLISLALFTLTLIGIFQALAGLVVVRRFAGRRPPPASIRVPLTILKPVCGDEALLEQAIASFCTQDYPDYQLILGAQNPDDPALAIARRVKARFPEADIDIVVDTAPHGRNGKIANLINMLPAAKHDMLVIADSDMHVRPDYLARVVAALQQPGTGLVTTLPYGVPTVPGIAARLGAMHMSHVFLPGALFSFAVGRQECLGGTMALRRKTLAQVGGLPALANHLADDNVLGGLVRSLGLQVRLADTVPVMGVQDGAIGALWQHEMRWARTIGALAPVAFAGSVIQFPLFWALLLLLQSGFASPAVATFAGACAVRLLVARGIDRALAPLRVYPAPRLLAWLLPLRDVMSVAEIVISFWSDAVVWRGQAMKADRGLAISQAAITAGLVEDETLAA